MANRIQQSALYKRLTDFLVGLLAKDSNGYTQRFPHDLERLRETLKPGDVVLVEGSQRVSDVIKYLTQSSWSHAALYVGDALLHRSPAQANQIRAQHGEWADAMLVEANIESGVCANPISKYAKHNIRICRPINLRPGDMSSVLETVIEEIGAPYNVSQILDLLRYFFPVTLIPSRLRRKALEHGGETSKNLICSSQIAMAFQRVRYPILPRLVGTEGGTIHRRGFFPEWLKPRRSRHFTTVLDTGVFEPCDPWLVTPRDFDLSPYFEIVKMSAAHARKFDYKTLTWSDQVKSTEVVAATGGDTEAKNIAPETASPAADETGDVPEAPEQAPATAARTAMRAGA